MKNSKRIVFFTALSVLVFMACGPKILQTPPPDAISVPTGGNAYVTQRAVAAGPDNSSERRRGGNDERIGEKGIQNWKNTDAVISAYFRCEQAGELDLFLKATVTGSSEVKLTTVGKTFNLKLKEGADQVIPVGRVTVSQAGYVQVNLQGVSKTGETYANISDIIVSGTATKGGMRFVNDFSFYWGRRGPSVHLGYMLPENEAIEWFYNEITVPEGNDVVGSYYMANGFGEGYFGIQVNSPTERRILFSVWSPYSTDNPKDIPDTHKIGLLKKGENVNTGEFGNEGSGGQSFMRYNWKAGVTYKFMTHIRPDGKGATVYTAYFFTPEENKWMLIAEFRRPLTNTYYVHPHSFLENFNPEGGYMTRQVHFSNQWALSKDGKWFELTKAKFTADETARKEARMDYKGGVTVQGNFFLQNCGFFSDYVVIGTQLERPASGNVPKVDISKGFPE